MPLAERSLRVPCGTRARQRSRKSGDTAWSSRVRAARTRSSWDEVGGGKRVRENGTKAAVSSRDVVRPTPRYAAATEDRGASQAGGEGPAGEAEPEQGVAVQLLVDLARALARALRQDG